jgi:hypothetical protein
MYSLHLIFSCCLFFLIVICYVRSRYASIFHPITYYLAFHGLVFVVRPCFQYVFDYDSIYILYGFHPTLYTKHLTLLITNIGLICFTAAALSTGNATMRFISSDRGVAGSADRGGRQLILVALVCAPIIIASIRVVMTTFTDYGADELWTSNGEGRTLLTQGTSGYMLDANVMLGTIGVLIAWVYRFKVLSFIPFGTFCVFRMAAGGGRWTFIMASTSLMLIYLYDRRKKWPLLKFSLYGVLLLFIFYQIGSYRRVVLDLIWQAPPGYNDPQVNSYSSRKGFFDDMDFGNLEYLEYVVMAVPEMTGTYDYFVNNLEIFTAWIPRNLWPNKPAGPPIEFYDLWDYGSPIGMTQSIVGRGWADLGVVGVAIWCSLGGAAWGFYYKWFAQSQQTRFEVATYAMMLPLSVQWFRDGVLITIVKFPLFWILPIALWLLVSKIWRVPARQSRAFSVQ